MKSIYFGPEANFRRIYNEESRNILEKECGLTDKIFNKDTVVNEKELLKDTEYIFSTWGMQHFTKEEIKEYFPSLKCVFYGAGSVQHFAREFIESGIKVFSAWGANAVPVAEYTVAQIILANKGFYLCARMTDSPNGRVNAQKYLGRLPGNFDTNIGIIGAGMIGKLVINMLKQYNLNVFVYDPYLSDESARELNVKKVSLNELFANCQVISNHVANLPATVGMLTYEQFSLMKDNAVFINTGRGAQVVEDDLIKVLEEKPEVCAVLDVTLPEPPEEGSKFYTLKNVFLTPHIAGSLGLEVQRMGNYMVDQFLKYKNGEKTEYEVTLKMLETMA